MTDVKKPIDWQALLKLANQKPELAKEILSMFAGELPILSTAINAAFQKTDYPELKNQIHKLHGSCCYVGTPRLKLLTEQMEELLQAHHHTFIPQLLAELNREIQRVQQAIQEESYVDD